MATRSILLFDFEPKAEYGHQLQNILQTDLDSSLECQVEVCQSRSVSTAIAQFSEVIATSQPAEAFLILNDAWANQAPSFIRHVHAPTASFSLLVVANRCGAREVDRMLRAGADDYITPPLQAASVLPRVWHWLRSEATQEAGVLALKKQLGLTALVGDSPVFWDEIRKIPVYAAAGAHILITGESGTGKEVCARSIHYLSPRSSRQFVTLNCGAIPADLMENELFGHESGAYTHATEPSSGVIGEADGGTLLLDEIDSLSMKAQVKLLRFLQSGEYRRLGSQKTQQADIRVIAATNTDLEGAIDRGAFRADLYYRLNVLRLDLPPLRMRREDVARLAQHYLHKCAEELKRPCCQGFHPEAFEHLMSYNWPGNIRELENVIQRAVALCKQGLLRPEDLKLPPSGKQSFSAPFQFLKAKAIAQFERDYLLVALQRCQGNISQAARVAHKDRRTFWGLLRKHNIKPSSCLPAGPNKAKE